MCRDRLPKAARSLWFGFSFSVPAAHIVHDSCLQARTLGFETDAFDVSGLGRLFILPSPRSKRVSSLCRWLKPRKEALSSRANAVWGMGANPEMSKRCWGHSFGFSNLVSGDPQIRTVL